MSPNCPAHLHTIFETQTRPYRNFDWRLIVSGEADQHKALPLSLYDLRQLKFGDVADMELGPYLETVEKKGTVMKVRVFPRITLPDSFGATTKISTVIGKTTWVFGIVGTDYRVEISLCHVWNRDSAGKLRTDTAPRIGGGISLYCRDWDDELGVERDVVTHPRAYHDFLSEMFPSMDGTGTDEIDNRIEGLTHCVELVQGILSAATAEAGA